MGAVKSCTISKKKDKAGTLDVAVQFLPSAGCRGLRCGIVLAFICLNVCVLFGKILNISQSVPVEMAESSNQKYPGVRFRRLSSIVGFVETWPSLRSLDREANSFRITEEESGMQVERNQCPVMIKPAHGMLYPQ